MNLRPSGYELHFQWLRYSSTQPTIVRHYRQLAERLASPLPRTIATALAPLCPLLLPQCLRPVRQRLPECSRRFERIAAGTAFGLSRPIRSIASIFLLLLLFNMFVDFNASDQHPLRRPRQDWSHRGGPPTTRMQPASCGLKSDTQK